MDNKKIERRCKIRIADLPDALRRLFDMSGEIAVLASDVARPYVRAAITKYGHLPRDKFQVLITGTCNDALEGLPLEDQPHLRQFFACYLPAAMMLAYDKLHAPAGGQG